MKFYITGIITAREEYREIIKNAILALIEPTRKEESSIVYNAHQSEDDPNVFTFYEIWENKEGFHFHMEQSYVIEFLEFVKDKMGAPLLLVKQDLL